jgi:hypothetical protein
MVQSKWLEINLKLKFCPVLTSLLKKGSHLLNTPRLHVNADLKVLKMVQNKFEPIQNVIGCERNL